FQRIAVTRESPSLVRMKRTLLVLPLVLAACGATSRRGTTPSTDTDRASVEAVLERYETALNTSDTNAAVGIYADDAIFMPQGSAPAVGRAAIRQSYAQIFAAVELHVTFTIDEVKVLGETAWMRTQSDCWGAVRGTDYKM